MTDATSDWELLRDYKAGSQQAFTELVNRHADWIYSVARRKVRDAHLAEDVAQAVFILLAQRAWKISANTVLQAWLLKVAHYASNHAIRAQSRRRLHESQSAPVGDCAPDQVSRASAQELFRLIDESMRLLGLKDQQALVLRFYQQKSLAQIATELQTTEEAARKRVTRALSRLKEMLGNKRLLIAPALLAVLMTDHAVQSAPAHLAASSGAAALAGASGAGHSFNIAKGVNRMFKMTKLKLAAVACMLLMLPGVFCFKMIEKYASAQYGTDALAANGAPAAAETERPPQVDLTRTNQTLIVVSKDKKRVWGFGIPVGKWSQPAIPAGDVAIFGTTTISLNVGEIQAGRRVYAYSAITGKWDSFEAPVGVKVEAIVTADDVTVMYDTHIWAFSSHIGKWDGIDTADANP